MYQFECVVCGCERSVLSEEIYNYAKDKPCDNCKTLKPSNKPNKRKLYKKECWKLTKENDLSVLDNYDKRSFNGYHLDHIVSINEGYKRNIPPKLIASIDNLQFIPREQNLSKNVYLTPKGKSLLNQWEL